MGMLLMMYRKLNLVRRRNNVEYKLTDLNQKLTEYQNLSGTLGSDNVTLSDIASMPASLFQSGIATLSQADAYGQMYAQQVMGMYGAGANSIFGGQGMYNIAYLKAYEQGRTQYSKQIMAQINEKEKQIQQEKVKLEAELETINEESKAVDKQLSEDVSQSVCHYGLQG